MKKPTFLVVILLIATAESVSASPTSCSIHPKKGATKEQLAAIAKISQEEASKIALATLKDPAKATVKEAELEAEHGCLVYSFDIAVDGKPGIQEVQVDAGNGKVISSHHESPKAEAAEKARDSRTPKN